MPYIKKERYLGKSTEARKSQLKNLEKGRGKQLIKTKDDRPSRLDPFSPIYKNNPCQFLEDHFYIPETMQPVVLEKWQKEEIFKPLFKINPKTGLRQHNLAVVSMPKKNGKSCLAAMVTLFFMFQDEPFGEIILTANSKDQTSWIVFDKLKKSILMNPYIFKEVEVGDEVLKVKKTGTVVRIIAPNYKTAAGANPTLVVFDELWAFELDAARKFWDELVTVPTRKQPLCLVVSYAGYDEDSLLYELWQKGQRKDKPKNYFFYWIHENKASWITKRYLEEQRNRPGMKANTYLRLHENRWISFESNFIDIELWDACVHREHHPLLSDKSKRLFVGVDIGLQKDTTGVAAVYKERNNIYLAAHRCFRPARKKPVKLEDVESYILQLHRNFTIRELRYDPYQFERSAEILRNQGIRLVKFPQTVERLTYMSGNLYDLIKNGNLVLYKDREFREHAQKATSRETLRGSRLVKRKASSKIDLIIALAMACIGAIETPSSYSGKFRVNIGRAKVGKTPSEILSGRPTRDRDLIDKHYREEQPGDFTRTAILDKEQ